MKQLFFFIILILCCTSISAANWIGGNGNWSVASNWDTGQVPDDNTTVLISNGTVEISSAALVRTLELSGNATLNIRTSGSLFIKNPNPADAPFIRILGQLNNDGLIEIISSATNSNNTAKLSLLNPGTLNNAGTVFISEGAGLCVSIGGLTSLNNSSSGTLIVEDGWMGIGQYGNFINDGMVSIAQMTTSGMDAYSNMTNNGEISIDHVEHEGIVIGNSTFTNNGDITILDATLSALQISNSGSLINNAGSEIKLWHTDNIALYHFGDDLRNYGLISIYNAFSGISTNISAQTTTNYASGTITINQVQSSGINNSGLFKNFGDITIQNVDDGLGLNNNGNFRNLGNGYVSIKDVVDKGINNFSNGLLVNQGLIELDNINGLGIFNNGSNNGTIFRNRFGGVVTLSNIDGRGILNRAYLHNKTGEITFATSVNTTFDIENEGTILNERCSEITLRQGINHTSGTINNNAWLISEFDDATGHLIQSTLNNDGVIQDEFGAFDINDIQNDGVILNPILGYQFVNDPISNALDLGSLSNATIHGWWTNITGTISAGTYNATNNAFTPNLQAQGATVLYVEVSHNLGFNCTALFLPVHFEYPILPPAPSAPIEGEENTGIQAFPNPSNGYFELRISDASYTDGGLTLVNALGQPINLKYPSLITSNSYQFDLSHLPAGTYYFRLLKSNGEQHGTAVVIR